MRIPTVVTKCKVASGVAVAVMAAGTIIEQPWLRGWALLAAVYAVGLCLRAAVDRAAEEVRAYIKKWSHQVFEDGFKSGVETGREMEAAERFVAQVDRH